MREIVEKERNQHELEKVEFVDMIQQLEQENLFLKSRLKSAKLEAESKSLGDFEKMMEQGVEMYFKLSHQHSNGI
jgi:hypothetical protein